MANQYQDQKTALAGAASLPIYLPARARDVTVKAIPGGGGTATVQFTCDEQSAVEANPAGANWEAWEPGAVSSQTSRGVVGTVTAFRITAVTATATLQVVAGISY